VPPATRWRPNAARPAGCCRPSPTPRRYADAVLGALDRADAGGELTATPATRLETGGSWDETARRLDVHRHTLRNRVDKAMRLTGRRLDDGDDRFDPWSATRIRRERPA
jgi:purine catabolism regulator